MFHGISSLFNPSESVCFAIRDLYQRVYRRHGHCSDRNLNKLSTGRSPMYCGCARVKRRISARFQPGTAVARAGRRRAPLGLPLRLSNNDRPRRHSRDKTLWPLRTADRLRSSYRPARNPGWSVRGTHRASVLPRGAAAQAYREADDPHQTSHDSSLLHEVGSSYCGGLTTT